MEAKTDYEREVRDYVKQFGGFFNAHVHGDRAFTYKDEYYSHVALSVSDIEKLPLKEKQSLVWALHIGTAFDKVFIGERMTKLLEDSIKYNVTRLDTCIDVTYNTKFKSLEVAERLKEKYRDKLELRLGAYNVSGFKDSVLERAEIFEEAVKRTDFLVALAEKDRKINHIGESQHNVYMLKLGVESEKPVHFHVGQTNTPEDRGAETLFEDMDWVYNKLFRLKNYPRNFLIHDISASCYSEDDFKRHCDKLIEFNLGIICCPSAGVSMKLDRNFQAPIHNSITRIWDFALREIPVYFGTDNINDVFVPSSTPDLYDEVFMLTHSLRGYNQRILAKIASGKELDNFDRGRIERAIN